MNAAFKGSLVFLALISQSAQALTSHGGGFCGGVAMNKSREHHLGDITAMGGIAYQPYTIEGDEWFGLRESALICLGGYQRFTAHSGDPNDFSFWQTKGVFASGSYHPWQGVLLPGKESTLLHVLGDFYGGLGVWMNVHSPLRVELNTDKALVPGIESPSDEVSPYPGLGTSFTGGPALTLGKSIRVNGASIDISAEARLGVTPEGQTTQVLVGLGLGQY